MGQLTIHQSGLHLSVQDKGRQGFQSLGVPESGALDQDALLIGNALVGNGADAAVLETCFGGVSFSCDKPMRVALTGVRETFLTVQDKASGESLSVPPYRSIDVAAGLTVTLGPLKDSFSAVVAIAGGVDVPLLYGSRATSPNAMIGGFEGRLLRSGDMLPLAEQLEELGAQCETDPSALFDDGHVFRVVMGPQDDRFTPKALENFFDAEYQISPISNRMGMRLDGKALEHIDNADIPSDGIVTGAIQVPGNGMPIILLADHQTTGGYTKIATVISADLPRLARMMPGQKISFKAVDITEAEDAVRRRLRNLERVISSIKSAPPLMDLGALYRLGDTT